MFRLKHLALASALLMSAVSAQAASTEDTLKKQFSSMFPQAEVQGVTGTDLKGIYQVEMANGQLLYMSQDGKFAFTGDMMRLESGNAVNVSEEWRSVRRVDSLKSLDDKDLVVFPAKGDEKAEVLVFTDTSCGYCRKFHSEIPAITKQGITVKYVAWPRYGVDSPAGRTMVNVWCSDDRLDAMSQAKSNKDVSKPKGQACKDEGSVVQAQIDLGRSIGVNGTPAVYTLDGKQLGGYVPADQLTKQLGLDK